MVGTITRVEEPEGYDKLYLLEVDIGKERRKIVAGLKKYYTKEELLGKQILLVRNMKPKKIGKFVSQGMLLAAENGERVGILTPLRKIEPGTVLVY